MSSTSAIDDLSLNSTCNVSRLKRLPWQTSHGTYTSGKNCISIRSSPCPWHASQRPPCTLKENLPGLYPRILLSGSSAYNFLISSNKPVYVPGLERGVRPIGDWSMLMILSRCSTPSIFSCSAAFVRAPINLEARALYRISLINVDFPEPETPVIHTSFPSGMETSIPFKLFADALIILSDFPLPSRLFFGTSICFRPDKYCPVSDFGCTKICFGVPSAMTCPPCSPAAGPRSITQSDSRMVSSSCSTTSTVLPRSRKPLSVSSKRALSRGCNPMDGSSSTYNTPTNLEPT